MLQKKEFVLPASFAQATIYLVEIANSKPTHPAVLMGKERSLISQTEAGN